MAAAKKPTKAQRELLKEAAQRGGKTYCYGKGRVKVANNCARFGWGNIVNSDTEFEISGAGHMALAGTPIPAKDKP